MKTALINSLLAATFLIPVIFLQSCKPDAPTADFSYEADGNTLSFQFTGTGEVDAFSWSFGDGETSATENPTHEYTSSGDFSVTLTVTNKGGSDSKTETVAIEGNSGDGDSPSLALGDADGALYAINTATTTSTGVGDYTINIGTAVAWFKDGTSFVDAGTVAWHQGSDSEDLDFNDDAKTYSWVETAQPSTGFDNSGISWSVAGGNGVSELTESDLTFDSPFPGVTAIDESSSSIDGGSSYTLSHNGSINNADSIYFSIYGPDANLLKRVGPNETSVTFSASEMESLGSGSAIMQIAAFIMKREKVDTKVYYMVNETVTSKTVTIE